MSASEFQVKETAKSNLSKTSVDITNLKQNYHRLHCTVSNHQTNEKGFISEKRT